MSTTPRTARAGIMLVAGAVLSLGACSSTSTSAPITPDVSTPATSDTQGLPSLPDDSNVALPSNWPTDIPVPKGLRLDRVIPAATGGGGNIAIYRGDGSPEVVNTQMTADLKAAGYTELSSFGPPVIRSSWSKGSGTVSLNINAAVGKVTCAITVRTS